MVNVAIIGGHGSGVIVAQALRDIAASDGKLWPLGFLNDAGRSKTGIDRLPVLGRFEDWALLSPDTLFIGAIHKPGLAAERHARLTSLGIPENRWATVIHPAAGIADAVAMGSGTYVGPHAVVMPGARVGKHCSLRAGCYISHDVQVGEFGFVGPNAVLNGRAKIGEGGHFGPAAVCLEETEIGDYAVVGIGAVVINDVPGGAVVAGNPARAVQG